MSRELTARFVEGHAEVELLLTGVGGLTPRRQLCTPESFLTSTREWLEGAAEVRRGTPETQVVEQLRKADAWVVNALATPMRYALFIEQEWRVAVGLRPTAQVMTLRYENEDGDEDPHELLYNVPARVIVGIWREGRLHSGIVALCEEGALPVAPTDTLHYLAPWCWGNASREGQVCWGSTTRPTYGQDGVLNVERTFFESQFNSDVTRYEDEDGNEMNLRSYWEDQQGAGVDVTVPLPVGSCTHSLPAMIEQAVRFPWGA